ncbi:hypothetical protein ACMYSQ_004096 [Aspergillus niger]
MLIPITLKAHFFDGDTGDVPAVNNAVTATGVCTALEAVTSTWPKEVGWFDELVLLQFL